MMAKLPTIQNGRLKPPISYNKEPSGGPKQAPIPNAISVQAIIVFLMFGYVALRIVMPAFQDPASAIPDKNLGKDTYFR